MPAVKEADQQKRALKVLAFCKEISTRILMEVSLDPREYCLDFIESESGFSAAINKNDHDIYFIDVTEGEGESRLRFFKDVTSQKFKGQRRIVLITDKPMPPEANQMRPFGPLCFVECFMTKARLAETLKAAMELKDTGVRVTSDPKFFDVTKLKQ